MKKGLIVSLFLLVAAFASAQTTIQVIPAVPVTAGQAACIGTYTGSVPGYVLCDNTAVSPAASVGVYLSAGTPPTRGVRGSGTYATLALNGQVTVPIPVYGTVFSPGHLVGDIDGSGNLADLGAPGTTSDIYALSYAGFAVSMNASLTQLTMVVQPGFVFDPPSPRRKP